MAPYSAKVNNRVQTTRGPTLQGFVRVKRYPLTNGVPAMLTPGVAHQRLRFGALAHHQRVAPAADFVRSFEEG